MFKKIHEEIQAKSKDVKAAWVVVGRYVDILWRILIDNVHKYAKFVCEAHFKEAKLGVSLFDHKPLCGKIFDKDIHFYEFHEGGYVNARYMFSYIDGFVVRVVNAYVRSFLPHIREKFPEPKRLVVFVEWVKLFKKELFHDTNRWKSYIKPKGISYDLENGERGVGSFSKWNKYILDYMFMHQYKDFNANWSFRHQFNRFLMTEKETKRKLDIDDQGKWIQGDPQNLIWPIYKIKYNNIANMSGTFSSGRSAIKIGEMERDPPVYFEAKYVLKNMLRKSGLYDKFDEPYDDDDKSRGKRKMKEEEWTYDYNYEKNFKAIEDPFDPSKIGQSKDNLKEIKEKAIMDKILGRNDSD